MKQFTKMRTSHILKIVVNLLSIVSLVLFIHLLVSLNSQRTYSHWSKESREEILELERNVAKQEFQQHDRKGIEMDQKQVKKNILDAVLIVPDEMDERTRELKEVHDYIYKTLDKLQNDGDCEQKKIIRCHNSVLSGFGSTIHRHVICLHIAFALSRAFFIDHDYESFNGLASFTQLESGKCSYLKGKLSNITDRCNFKDRRCYKDETNFEISNTYKLLEFTHEADFPAPKYIPGTLPGNMKQKLEKLGVKSPWHWFTAQLLGYMVLRPNKEFQEIITQHLTNIQLQKESVGAHVRRGIDKIGKY